MSKREKVCRRIEELSQAIRDIEYRRSKETDREHPSKEYVHSLRFELRRFQVQLERMIKTGKKDENA